MYTRAREVLAARTRLSCNELSADFGPAHLPIIIDRDAGRQRCACRLERENPFDAAPASHDGTGLLKSLKKWGCNPLKIKLSSVWSFSKMSLRKDRSGNFLRDCFNFGRILWVMEMWILIWLKFFNKIKFKRFYLFLKMLFGRINWGRILWVLELWKLIWLKLSLSDFTCFWKCCLKG